MFFPNWGTAEGWMLSIAIVLVPAFIFALVKNLRWRSKYFYYKPDRSQWRYAKSCLRKGNFWGIVAWIFLVPAVVLFVWAPSMEAGRNDKQEAQIATQVRQREANKNQRCLSKLEEAGFKVNEVKNDCTVAVLQGGACLWEYYLDEQGWPIRGSRYLVYTPPLSPQEVGQDAPDDPPRVCAEPT